MRGIDELIKAINQEVNSCIFDGGPMGVTDGSKPYMTPANGEPLSCWNAGYVEGLRKAIAILKVTE